jgi:hypothetical protein
MATKIGNVADFREAAEMQLDFDYVENEGPCTVRFDKGGRSAWANQDGCIEGDPMMVRLLERVAQKM